MQGFRGEGLEKEAVSSGDYVGRRVAAADGEEAGVTVGAELLDKVGSTQVGHLRVHEDDAGGAGAVGEELERGGATFGGVDGVTAHSEDGGHYFAADGVVVNEQDGWQIPLATEIEHGNSVPLRGGVGL